MTLHLFTPTMYYSDILFAILHIMCVYAAPIDLIGMDRNGVFGRNFSAIPAFQQLGTIRPYLSSAPFESNIQGLGADIIDLPEKLVITTVSVCMAENCNYIPKSTYASNYTEAYESLSANDAPHSSLRLFWWDARARRQV
jgi:hypothetical protein